MRQDTMSPVEINDETLSFEEEEKSLFQCTISKASVKASVKAKRPQSAGFLGAQLQHTAVGTLLPLPGKSVAAVYQPYNRIFSTNIVSWHP